jgi:hypothetical protein
MSQIRKSHSVEIIEHRLRAAESADVADAMELVGLHDELSRVERKWREKAEGRHQPANSRTVRPLADASAMNARSDRLRRLVEARLRKPIEHDAERKMLKQVAAALTARKPLVATEAK